MLKPKAWGKNGGFTLIELLIVIAIIGILSSIIIASLAKARGKGSDAKVKAQLASLRDTAESYFDTNGSYSVAANCTEGMFIDSDTGMISYTTLSNYPASTVLKCHSDGSSYAVSASLITAGTFWCVDSNGGVKSEPSDPGDTLVCP